MCCVLDAETWSTVEQMVIPLEQQLVAQDSIDFATCQAMFIHGVTSGDDSAFAKCPLQFRLGLRGKAKLVYLEEFIRSESVQMA